MLLKANSFSRYLLIYLSSELDSKSRLTYPEFSGIKYNDFPFDK